MLKDDFQSVLRSPSILMFIDITYSKSHAMKCKSMLFVMKHTLSLRPFKFFFQQLHWFLQLRSCFIKWYEKERSIKLCIHNGGRHETLNLLHVSSCKIFTFCDVLHVLKTISLTKLTRVCNTDWKSSLKISECHWCSSYMCSRDFMKAIFVSF